MWKKHQETDILKKLGIVERGPSSLSEDEGVLLDNMVTASEGEQCRDEPTDDENMVFDKDALLAPQVGSSRSRTSSTSSAYGGGGRSRNRMAGADSTTIRICRGLLVSTVFFSIGLCLSIVGPTLPDLQWRTNTSSLGRVTGVISANAFGSIVGLAFAGSLLSCVNVLCTVAIVLLLCAGCTVFIPWCSSLTLVTIICFAQGICIGFLERAGYSLFYSYWRRRHKILQLFYLVLSLGACITPLITTPFVFHKLINSESDNDISGTDKPLWSSDLHNRHDRDVSFNGTLSTVFDDVNNDTTVKMVYDDIRKPDVAVNEEIKPKSEKIDEQKQVAKVKAELEEIKKANESAIDLVETKVEGRIETLDNSSVDSNYTIIDTSSTSSSTKMTSSSTKMTTSTSTSTTTTSPTPTTSKQTTTIEPNSKQLFSDIPNSATTSSAPHNRTLSASLMELGWDLVLDRVGQFNRVRFAYLVISLLSTVSTLFFGVFCCCVPCRTALKMPSKSPSDSSLSPKAMCSNRNNLQALILSMVFSFLTISLESTAYNLLTVYMLQVGPNSQLSGVLLTSTYWACVSLSRFVTILCSPKLFTNASVLTFSLSASLLSTALLAVASTYSYPVLYIGVMGLGIGVAPLFPVGYSWLDGQLNFSPWVGTLWLAAAHLGRLIVPAMTGSLIFVRQSPKVLMLSLLVCSLLLVITYLFLSRVCKEASQLIAVNEFTRQIRQANGDVAKYSRMPEDLVELDALDQFDMEADDIHFDRSRDMPHQNGSASRLQDGLFDLYLRK